MGHSPHHHHRGRELPTRQLVAVGAATVAFGVIQIVVGISAGSLVVLADAGHQMVDAIGLVIALGSLWLARRAPDERMTFGWAKAEALGSYTACLLLIGSLGWVGVESVRRLFDSPHVAALPVLACGAGGLVVNAAGVLLLGSSERLAVRAARLHLLNDLAGSALVLVTGAAVLAGAPAWIDSVASLVVALVVLRSAVRVLMSAATQLLDRAPSRAHARALVDALKRHPAVREVHHVHVRHLGSDDLSATAHVTVAGDLEIHDAQLLVDQLRREATRALAIGHLTLQLECHPCGDLRHHPQHSEEGST